jgi:hypothetical protein
MEEQNMLNRSHHTHPVHPLGTRARILLTSVFGPYAQDDDYGSRKINPMELYQNQVTRVQGGFSQSWIFPPLIVSSKKSVIAHMISSVSAQSFRTSAR